MIISTNQPTISSAENIRVLSPKVWPHVYVGHCHIPPLYCNVSATFHLWKFSHLQPFAP
jgi:hypothetical protein